MIAIGNLPVGVYCVCRTIVSTENPTWVPPKPPWVKGGIRTHSPFLSSEAVRQREDLGGSFEFPFL